MTKYAVEWLEVRRGTFFVDADSMEDAKYAAETEPESTYNKSLEREDFSLNVYKV